MKRIGIYNRFVESAEDLKGRNCEIIVDNFGAVVDNIEEQDTLVFASPISLGDIDTKVLVPMINNLSLGFEVVGYFAVGASDFPCIRAMALMQLGSMDAGLEVAFKEKEKVKKLLDLGKNFSISINGQDYFLGDSIEDVLTRLKKSYERGVITRFTEDEKLQAFIPDINVSAIFEERKLISITAEIDEFDGVSFWENGLSQFLDEASEEFDNLLESGTHTRECNKFSLNVDENRFICVDTGKKLKYKQCQMVKASGNTCESCEFGGEDVTVVVKELPGGTKLTMCEQEDKVYFTLSK